VSLLGANNQHVVPSHPQPWAEYYNPTSRWVATAGRQWGAADPSIDIGTCDPHNLNEIAYRTNNAVFFLGEKAWKYTVRGNGCTACPIRCHTRLKVPAVATKYGIPATGQNTCVGLLFGRSFFKEFPDGPKGETAIEACMVGMHLADDLGIWDNYGQLQRDFQELYYNGMFRRTLDEKEFKSYSWEKYEKGDPSFLLELLPRIANREGELATALGSGTASPLRERGYRGDDSIESMLYSLATGDRKSRQELDRVTERIFVLHRALTIRDMGTTDMRKKHDTIPDWVFEFPKDKAALSKGSIRMDKEDIKLAMDMYYQEMGWDKRTGAPTREAYQRLGLGDVADELSKLGLLA